MRIIISPAKKMNIDTDSLAPKGLPVFLSETKRIREKLQEMTPEELKKLWKCSDKLAAQNVERLEQMDLQSRLTPAVLSYEGIQYQYMSPSVFSDEEYDYIEEHLRILSGFYGVLKPFDGVTPYRLEMQAKLQIDDANNLYAFWGSRLADYLSAETDCIINLASKEYSMAVEKHLPENCQMITCVFGEVVDEKIVEKGTLCKMARGEMVRRMAEARVKSPEELKALKILDYTFAEKYSDEKTFVFIREN